MAPCSKKSCETSRKSIDSTQQAYDHLNLEVPQTCLRIMDLNGVEENMTTSTENPTASPTTTTNTTDTDTGERDNHGKKTIS